MKKIKIMMMMIMVCFTSFSFCQTKSPNNLYLSPTDLIKQDTFLILKDKKYKVYDGNDKITLVDIDLIVSNKIKIKVDSLNQMIMTSNMTSRYKVKNKLTYSPKKFFIMKDGDGWGITETLQAQNDFGVLKEINIYYFFNKNFEMNKEITIVSQ